MPADQQWPNHSGGTGDPRRTGDRAGCWEAADYEQLIEPDEALVRDVAWDAQRAHKWGKTYHRDGDNRMALLGFLRAALAELDITGSYRDCRLATIGYDETARAIIEPASPAYPAALAMAAADPETRRHLDARPGDHPVIHLDGNDHIAGLEWHDGVIKIANRYTGLA